MLTPILRTALPMLVAGGLGLPLAHADIYTWADASGAVNVSNLAPPQGARVISVTRTSPADVARENAARDAARRAETLALEERVRQLEADAELAKRQPPPQVVYPVIPPPPSTPYRYDPAPPPDYSTPVRPIFSTPVTQTYARQAGFIVRALAGSTALPPSPSFDADLSAVRGADVVLFFLESYGAVAYEKFIAAQEYRDLLHGC